MATAELDRTRIEPAVSPYLYDVLWNVAVHGPLTAQEIAEDHNRPVHTLVIWTAQAAANRLRALIRLGLLARDEDGFYLLTDKGRRWMLGGADGD
jgi:predicted transcriptional regulator